MFVALTSICFYGKHFLKRGTLPIQQRTIFATFNEALQSLYFKSFIIFRCFFDSLYFETISIEIIRNSIILIFFISYVCSKAGI